jgi:murein DD-endopeptidase MepM/ murein hydrolase activator NlpD
MTLKYYLTLGKMLFMIFVLILIFQFDISVGNYKYRLAQKEKENLVLKQNIVAIGGFGLKPEIETKEALEIAKQYKKEHNINKYKWKYKELAKPIENGYITSETGERRINGELENSKSTDWKAELDITVDAGFFGKVEEVGYSDIYGNYIILKGMVLMELIKDNPEIKKIEMRYSHLSQIFVSKGKYVQKGQEIGYIGNSGRCATWDDRRGIWREITEKERGEGYGTHLDIELKINGYLRNPFANSTFGKVPTL